MRDLSRRGFLAGSAAAAAVSVAAPYVPGAFRKNVQGVLQFGATQLWNVSA